MRSKPRVEASELLECDLISILGADGVLCISYAFVETVDGFIGNLVCYGSVEFTKRIFYNSFAAEFVEVLGDIVL